MCVTYVLELESFMYYQWKELEQTIPTTTISLNY